MTAIPTAEYGWIRQVSEGRQQMLEYELITGTQEKKTVWVHAVSDSKDVSPYPADVSARCVGQVGKWIVRRIRLRI